MARGRSTKREVPERSRTRSSGSRDVPSPNTTAESSPAVPVLDPDDSGPSDEPDYEDDEFGGYVREWEVFLGQKLVVDVPSIPQIPASQSVRQFLKAKAELRAQRLAALKGLRLIVTTPSGPEVQTPPRWPPDMLAAARDWACQQLGLWHRFRLLSRLRRHRKGGRPAKLTFPDLMTAKMRWHGLDDKKLAERLGVSQRTVVRVRKQGPRLGKP